MSVLGRSASLAVIVPTYCEAENLPELTRRVFKAVQDAGIETELIVVDDNSQDGTEHLCQELASKYPLRLITRVGERGLATAVLHGIKESKNEYIIVMDADLSHPPEAIPHIYELLRKEVDFVVGSRYMKGGSTDAKWGLFRWLNSRVATLLARGLTSIKDPMAGYFGFPRRILDGSSEFIPIGYKIGLEILVKARCQKIMEIPIAFVDRTKGESKLTLQQQLNYLRHLRRLYRFRYPQTAEIIHFASVGSSGVIVDLIFYLTLTYGVRIDHQLARAMSFIAAASWNWYLNRWVTFLGGRDKQWGRQWLEFVTTASVGFTVNWGSYKVLTDYVPYFMQHHMVAFFIGTMLGAAFNYTFSRWFVFRPFEEAIGLSKKTD